MKRLWLILVALLVGFLIWRWLFPVKPPAISVAAATVQGSADIEQLLDSMDKVSDFPSAEVYKPMEDRPLFFSERRPPELYTPTTDDGKESAKAAGATSRLRVQLKGIVTVADQSYALIGGGRQKASQRIRVGDEVAGWKVSVIAADKVEFTNGGETETLLLRTYKPVLPSSRNANKATGAKRGKIAKKPDSRKKAPPASKR